MARTRARHDSAAAVAVRAGAAALAGAALLVSGIALSAPATTPRAPTGTAIAATAAPATGSKAAGSKAAGSKAADGQIAWDAAKVTADAKNNSVAFQDIVVTWRDIKVKADRAHASGLDTENNEWTFDGNVRIHGDRGDLKSDKAVLEYKNGEIAKATVTGNPAEFEQASDNADRPVRAHAGEIVYSVTDQLLRLSDDALLTIGQAKVNAAQIEYNIRTQTYEAAKQPGTDGRVHGTIPPRQKDPQKDNNNKP
jgi:lipopolysaccharide export system protein LptA